jgi:hypothetical protein
LSELYENDTLIFKLDVECEEDKMTVYSKDLKWVPIGGQKEFFGKNKVRPVNDDIIITKL